MLLACLVRFGLANELHALARERDTRDDRSECAERVLSAVAGSIAEGGQIGRVGWRIQQLWKSTHWDYTGHLR